MPRHNIIGIGVKTRYVIYDIRGDSISPAQTKGSEWMDRAKHPA